MHGTCLKQLSARASSDGISSVSAAHPGHGVSPRSFTPRRHTPAPAANTAPCRICLDRNACRRSSRNSSGLSEEVSAAKSAHAAGRGSRAQCTARSDETTASTNPPAGPKSPQREIFMTPVMRATPPAIPAAHHVAVQAGSMPGRSLLRWNVMLPRPEKRMLLLMHPPRLAVLVIVRTASAA